MSSPAARPATGQLNPTLAVDVYFSVQVHGDTSRTKLGLAQHPQMVAWLLSVLDYIRFRQGKLAANPGIAAPPGGAIREALIRGGVILAQQRPDGGLALRLNPEIDLRLCLDVRLRGEPARNTLLALGDDPDLSRWLLMYHLQRPTEQELAALDEPLLATLRRHGVLVDELPPGEAYLPDPAAPADLAAELAPMSRIFLQDRGQAIPVEVAQRMGRHAPALPPDAALAWGEDAGTGMVYPILRPADADEPALARLVGRQAAQRAAQWHAQRDGARLELRTRRYAALREIVPPAQQAKLRRYVRQLVGRGYFPALGDGQVELRSAIHNQQTVASLHHGLAGVVSSICDEPVIASYCYLSCYEAGAVLERHKDRPQCVYNLSLVLDMDSAQGEPAPWPIYLEIDGQAESVLLQVGDGLVYSGTEIWHWRDALPAGQRAVVCFFHFVPHDFAGSLY